MLEAKILLLLLLGLMSEVFNCDSSEEGFDIFLNNDPWWQYGNGDKSILSSFGNYYPFFEGGDDPGTFDWYLPPIKGPLPSLQQPPPVQPAPPIQPSPPSSQSDSSTREWPSWIPPIRLIKLPLDEPPEAIQRENALSYFDFY